MSTTPLAQARETRQRALWEQTAVVAGRLNRAHAELVEIAAELVEDGHWGDGGFKSPEHYLVVRAGLSPQRAREVVRVARRRRELTEAATALDAGELSLDQVAVVATVPTAYQASVTGLARDLTVPQLRRVVARHAFAQPGSSTVGDADGAAAPPRAGSEAPSEAERRACAKPELSMGYDADGRFQLRYSAPATIGALVEQAVREAKDALFGRRQDQQTAGTVADGSGMPTYADALEEIAHRSLASVTSSSRRARYRVYLHLDTAGAWVNGGHAIPLRLLGRFISDGTVQPVWETEGRPVSVGRAMRILPDRTRRLIEDRDRGCRFPGCTSTGFVEVHHLEAWADGGATDEGNQVSLCTVHHDGIDRGDYTLTGDPTRPDGLVATNRYGIPIRPPGPDDTAPPPGGDPLPPPGTYRPPTGEALPRDLEVPPDAGVPRPPLRLVRSSSTPRGTENSHLLDDPLDALVFDSYRRR